MFLLFPSAFKVHNQTTSASCSPFILTLFSPIFKLELFDGTVKSPVFMDVRVFTPHLQMSEFPWCELSLVEKSEPSIPFMELYGGISELLEGSTALDICIWAAYYYYFFKKRPHTLWLTFSSNLNDCPRGKRVVKSVPDGMSDQACHKMKQSN